MGSGPTRYFAVPSSVKARTQRFSAEQAQLLRLFSVLFSRRSRDPKENEAAIVVGALESGDGQVPTPPLPVDEEPGRPVRPDQSPPLRRLSGEEAVHFPQALVRPVAGRLRHVGQGAGEDRYRGICNAAATAVPTAAGIPRRVTRRAPGSSRTRAAAIANRKASPGPSAGRSRVTANKRTPPAIQATPWGGTRLDANERP